MTELHTGRKLDSETDDFWLLMSVGESARLFPPCMSSSEEPIYSMLLVLLLINAVFFEKATR